VDLLFVILIFAALIGIYDVIRRVNQNVLEQKEEIKKLREEINQMRKPSDQS